MERLQLGTPGVRSRAEPETVASLRLFTVSSSQALDSTLDSTDQHFTWSHGDHADGSRHGEPSSKQLVCAKISRDILCERCPSRAYLLSSPQQPPMLAGVLAGMPQDERKQFVAASENERAVIMRAYEAVQCAEEVETQEGSTRTSTGSRMTRSKHISYPPLPRFISHLSPPSPPPSPAPCLHHALTHHGTDQGAEG